MADNKKIKNFILVSGAVAAASFAVMGVVAKRKKPSSVYDDKPEEKNPFEGKKVRFVEDEADAENADGVKGHLEEIGEAEYRGSLYDKYGKRALDVFLSGMGLIILSPVFLGISVAIKIDDPGPVLFTQKRVGKNKQYFKLHKIITGSSGGMFLTDYKADADKVRKWSTQSREAAPWYQHEEIGYNYRI